MILKVVPIRIIKEDDFDVYLKSPNYEKTKAKIEKDSQTAQEFFSTLSKGILKEIQKQIQSDNSNNDLKEFEAFCVKQSANYNEYKNRFQGKVKQFFNLIKCENFLNNLNALRGIRGI